MKKLFKNQEEIEFVKNGLIGKGTSGVIKKIRHKNNPSVIYALKEMPKVDAKEITYIEKEIQLHSKLISPYVVQLYDYIETPSCYFLILEYCENEDLFELIVHSKVSQKKLIKIFYQICKGIKCLHDKDIIHRDLKPENIFLDENLNAKVGDLGWAAGYTEEFSRSSICGTFEYNAQEVFVEKIQTKKVDIWSLGCILYFMLHKRCPFKATSVYQLREQMKDIEENVIFETKNKDAIDLIKKILKYEPQERPTIKEILKDKLFMELRQKELSRLNNNMLTQIQQKRHQKYQSPVRNFQKNKKNELQVLLNQQRKSRDKSEKLRKIDFKKIKVPKNFRDLQQRSQKNLLKQHLENKKNNQRFQDLSNPNKVESEIPYMTFSSNVANGQKFTQSEKICQKKEQQNIPEIYNQIDLIRTEPNFSKFESFGRKTEPNNFNTHYSMSQQKVYKKEYMSVSEKKNLKIKKLSLIQNSKSKQNFSSFKGEIENQTIHSEYFPTSQQTVKIQYSATQQPIQQKVVKKYADSIYNKLRQVNTQEQESRNSRSCEMNLKGLRLIQQEKIHEKRVEITPEKNQDYRQCYYSSVEKVTIRDKSVTKYRL